MFPFKIADEKIFHLFIFGSLWSKKIWCCPWHQIDPGWWRACHPLAPPVVLLPGVSVTDAQVFVNSLYGRDIVNNRHFTVTEDTGVVNEEICSDKSGSKVHKMRSIKSICLWNFRILEQLDLFPYFYPILPHPSLSPRIRDLSGWERAISTHLVVFQRTNQNSNQLSIRIRDLYGGE